MVILKSTRYGYFNGRCRYHVVGFLHLITYNKTQNAKLKGIFQCKYNSWSNTGDTEWDQVSRWLAHVVLATSENWLCWDPICTVADAWCCSEHYLWLFDGGLLLEPYTAVYYCALLLLIINCVAYNILLLLINCVSYSKLLLIHTQSFRMLSIMCGCK